MPINPEDRLILSGRGLSEELDKIIAEEEYQERAAIKEFLGNMPREQAEREAREEMRKRVSAVE